MACSLASMQWRVPTRGATKRAQRPLPPPRAKPTAGGGGGAQGKRRRCTRRGGGGAGLRGGDAEGLLEVAAEFGLGAGVVELLPLVAEVADQFLVDVRGGG